MKVVGFVGSPREKSNTEILVSLILAQKAKKGAQTKLFNLAKLNLKPCLGCYCCMTKNKCIVKDDMFKLVEEIQQADALVIGSPVYMGQMSAQTKIFFDRLHILLNPDYTSRLRGEKKVFLVFAQGEENPKAYQSYFKGTAKAFNFLGFKVKGFFVAPGLEKRGQVSKEKNVLAQLKKQVEGSEF